MINNSITQCENNSLEFCKFNSTFNELNLCNINKYFDEENNFIRNILKKTNYKYVVEYGNKNTEIKNLVENLGLQYLIDNEKSNIDTLTIIPINTIGNMSCPSKFLNEYFKDKTDLIITGFNCTENADSIRSAFYQNNLASEIKRCHLSEGILFTDFKEFYSIAYYENTLKNLLQKSDYSVVEIQETNIGLYFYCKLNGLTE